MSRRAAELRVADQIGAVMEFWGFKRVHGRVWSILYLSSEPLSAAEIRDRLGVSVGATSMALAELRRWGAVREVRTSARSMHFEPETNIWVAFDRTDPDFVLTHDDERPLVFIAAGQGFAPVKGLIEHAMAAETCESIHLV